MYSQNLSLSTVSVFKASISFLLCLSLFSCSTTEQVNENYFSDDGYIEGFVSDNFTHSQFTPMNKNTIKKSLPSDNLLMMTLLNRTIPADQAMMLAFEQQRNDLYANPYENYAVQIKGDKSSDYSSDATEHAYAKLISLDINAVRITAPK